MNQLISKVLHFNQESPDTLTSLALYESLFVYGIRPTSLEFHLDSKSFLTIYYHCFGIGRKMFVDLFGITGQWMFTGLFCRAIRKMFINPDHVIDHKMFECQPFW